MPKATESFNTIRARLLAGALTLAAIAVSAPARAQPYARVGAEYLENQSSQVVATQPLSVAFYATSALCNTALTNLTNAGVAWGNAVNTAQSLTGTAALAGSAAGGCINNGTTSFTATTTVLHINQTYFSPAGSGAQSSIYNFSVDVPTDAASGSGCSSNATTLRTDLAPLILSASTGSIEVEVTCR
jgi:hypothetical protein